MTIVQEQAAIGNAALQMFGEGLRQVYDGHSVYRSFLADNLLSEPHRPRCRGGRPVPHFCIARQLQVIPGRLAITEVPAALSQDRRPRGTQSIVESHHDLRVWNSLAVALPA